MQVFKTISLVLALASASGAAAQQQAPKPVTRAAVAGQLDNAFAGADANHDGSLNVGEIQALENKELQQVQANLRARMQAQFKVLDTNKDGQLSLQEFSAAAPNVKANETAAQLLQKLDTNHDGKISIAEFRAQRLAQFDKVDLNHDGTVTPDEERRSRGQR
jgi:hypothetical protein